MKKNCNLVRKRWLLLSLFLVFTTSFSQRAYSQEMKLSFSLKNATLKDVISEIKRISAYDFVYSDPQLTSFKQRDVSFKNATIQQVMEDCLKDTKLTYAINGNTIVFKLKATQEKEQELKYISGVVTDQAGNPLPGATLLIKGTTTGMATNTNGEYKIGVPKDGECTLIFSFMGMKTQYVKVGNKTKIDVKLEEDLTEVEEVVVTGYQNIDKRHLTSAVSSVKASDILTPGMTSIDQALEGRIPELVLISNSGEVGATPRIRVRGTSTLLGNREPLWVLDGFIMHDPVNVSNDDLNNPDYINIIGNAIAGINPQDIERIDVLKDASATALYGTRAANGVIVVTTKKGAIGPARFSYNHSSKYTRRPRYSDRNINLMNSQERVQFGKELSDLHYQFPSDMTMVGYEGALDSYYKGLSTYDEFVENVKWYETVNTDWLGILMKDSYSHNHTVSISGGTDQLRYYSSVGYTKDNDVIKGQGISRYTGNLSLESDLTKWLKASMDFNANISERNYEQSAVGSVNYAYTTSRAIAAYEEGGDLSYYQKRYNSFYRYDFNILNERANSYTKQENSGFDLTSRLIFRFTDWLNGDVLFNYAVSNADNEDYWGESTYHVACIRKSNYGVAAPSDSELPYGGELSEQNTRNKTYSLRAQLNLNKYFGEEEKHNINGALGYEMSSSRYKGYQNTSRGYYADRGKNFTSVGASD
mgnify:CR=1 FL=1